MRKVLWTALFFALCAALVFGEGSGALKSGALNAGNTEQTAKKRGDYLTIKLAVIGVGDEFYTWWGHLGVIVKNELTGQTLLYDYGVFSFSAEHFLGNLIAGNWYYSMMARDADDDIDWYIKTNRDIVFYTLNLSAAQKEKMLDFLNWNSLPENRRYYYKIFTDNCVTRVVYLLDDVLDGRFLARYRDEPGRLTVRHHANRHLYRSPVLYWILNFVMGQDIDTPPNKFAEMFLPEEFGKYTADFSYTDESGALVPLVTNVEVVNTSAGRKLPLPDEPAAGIPAAISGVLLALFFGFIYLRWTQGGEFAGKRRGARALLGITQALWGFFLGIFGTLLFYAEFFSNHIYTYNNINVVFINPLLLAALPLGLIFAFTKKQKTMLACKTALKILWTYVLLGALLTIVVKISPSFFQVNFLTLLVVMPPALVLSFMPNKKIRMAG
ncbi:MAG: DUF4105 domain-containing protein [Spirochaetaceae bacterium]|jgi:hypothetical protein|nr:DUF4105 domain-containing protein [Spirochaetaceae bacterium]